MSALSDNALPTATSDRFAGVFGADRGRDCDPPRPRTCGALRFCPKCAAQFGMMSDCAWCEVPLRLYPEFDLESLGVRPLELTLDGRFGGRRTLRMQLIGVGEGAEVRVIELSHKSGEELLMATFSLQEARDVAAGRTTREVGHLTLFGDGERDYFARWLALRLARAGLPA